MTKGFLTCFLLVLALDAAHSDAPPHDQHNHYTGGTKTVLTLTEEQIVFLDSRKTHWTEIKIRDPFARWQSTLLKLTRKQIASLEKDSGCAPSRMEVWETRSGVWDCSCGAANLALRFSATQVEVPHAYLKSDQDAERLWREFCEPFK